MNTKLTYINQGRGGRVVYSDPISSIPFDFEFGGGDCVAIIFVPSIAGWVTETQRPLSDRDEILLFVARQSLQDQVSNGSYKIMDNCIELFNS